MIICAAIKVSGFRKDLNKFDTAIVCGLRHGDCYNTIKLFENNWDKIKFIEGFLDSDGYFYTRKEAYREAFKIGQLTPTVENFKSLNNEDELYSEDLY